MNREFVARQGSNVVITIFKVSCFFVNHKYIVRFNLNQIAIIQYVNV